jgi:hypothetical protein
MRAVLVRKFGFPDRDVQVLTDENATRPAIEQAFRDHLIGPARPGDVVVFYFSGHGQLVPDATAWSGTRPALVTSDYVDQDARNGYQTHLRSDHIRELLRELKGRMRGQDGKVEGNITVFLDSCHSGGGTKNEMTAKGRAWDDKIDGPRPQLQPGVGARPKGPGGYLDADQAVAEGYVFLSACRSEQVAYCPAQGTRLSQLTYHLARALSRATPATTYRDLFEPLSVELSAVQIPQLEGEANKRLLDGAAEPSEDYWAVQGAKEGVVTLPVGQLQGMTKFSHFTLFKAGASVKRPENKIAEAVVQEVETNSCRARLTAEFAGKVKDEELQAARAVEARHNYAEQSLRVWLDSVLMPSGWVEENDYISTEVPTYTKPEGDLGKAYDVVLRHPKVGQQLVLGKNGRPVLQAERPDGTVLGTYEDDERAPRLIRARLLGEWRWLFLSRSVVKRGERGDRVYVKARIVPLEVELNSEGKVTKVVGKRKDFDDKDEAPPLTQFHVGDYVTVQVKHFSQEPVYISIIHLWADGAVVPRFPPNNGTPLSQYTPAKLPVGGGWQTILPGGPQQGITNFVIKLTKPVGKEMFKVVATLEPADFRGLLYLPPDAVVRDGDSKGVPEGSRALGLLLDSARTGKKGGVDAGPVQPNWATAEAVYELVDRPAERQEHDKPVDRPAERQEHDKLVDRPAERQEHDKDAADELLPQAPGRGDGNPGASSGEDLRQQVEELQRRLEGLESLFPVPQACFAAELPREKWKEAKEKAIAENPANEYKQSPDGVSDRSKVPAGVDPTTAGTKGVFSSGRKWRNGATLRVRFMGGDPRVRQKVSEYARQWSDYANIKFEFVDRGFAEIRVSFNPGGSQSAVGTDALTVPQNQPTMNFGWLTPDSKDDVYSSVVLHEFGHALGLIHEHNHPQGGITWNKPVVYAATARQKPPWSRQQTDFNIFKVYNQPDAVFTRIDGKSIMMYPIAEGWASKDGKPFVVGWNTKLSEDDKDFIASQYPKPRTSPSRSDPKPEGSSRDDLRQQLDELRRRVEAIESRLKQQDEGSARPAGPPPPHGKDGRKE